MFLLTRYFLHNLLGRQLLDEEGIVGLRRVAISAGAGIASVGLFLPRLFHKKFADLDALPDPEPFRRALFSDGLLMICIVTMLAAFVAALVAPSMFPDEVDYTSLTPLPLPRGRIFGAKFLALGIFAGAFIVAGLLLFGVSFPIFTNGRWAEHGRVARTSSFLVAAAAGATFAFLAVMAAQGLVLVALPRRLVHRASMVVQSATIAGLIISAPFVYHVTTQSTWLWGHPASLIYFPPAWFAGIEQTLIGAGDRYLAGLARTGLLWLGGAAFTAFASYAWLYRSAERLISAPPSAAARRTAAGQEASRTASGKQSGPPIGKPLGAGSGVWTFTTATLARHRLPQLVFLIAWAAGIAIAANILYGGLRPTVVGNQRGISPILSAAVSMPVIVALMAVAGLRSALRLPVGMPANWVFRLTDWPSVRADRLKAVEHAFFRLALLPVVILFAPIQLAALGPSQGFSAVLLTTLASFVVLEVTLIGWNRVPFTCTWLPGKRPLPLSVLAVLGVCWVTAVFVDLVTLLIPRGPRAVTVLSVVLVAIGSAIRWWRRRSWAALPLEFEDEDPAKMQQLGLGPN